MRTLVLLSALNPVPQARLFYDAEGMQWRVYERVLPFHWRERRRPVLIFENQLAYHTVTDFPAGWHELPERALAVIVERA
ncbi:MAG TPA: hypothetical protein VNA89_13535 [Gemmatimonadaceae bacterium]|nr:hypothetical protein [Gemmatimonadaceae bacterium]